MPGSKKLIDILDEMNFKDNEILNKMGRLLKLIESTNPSMDDPDLRWIENKIEEFDGGVVPNRQELEYANTLWKIYK